MLAFLNHSSPQGGFLPALKIIEEHAFSLLLETFFFTLYIGLITYLVYHICATRKTRSLPSFVLVYTLSMFALYSVYWTLDVYFLWAEFHSLSSPRSESLNGPDAQDVHWKGASWIGEDGLLPQYLAPVYVQYMVELILIVLGDFVSLWRAYAVWGQPRWLYIVIGCVGAVESVIYILICAGSSTEYLSSSGSTSSGVQALAEARTPLTFVRYSVTALAQLGSTTLIAYKAWLHWRDVREFMHRSATRRSLTALAIIIESGIVYLVLLAWYGSITYFGGSSSLLVYTCRFYSAPLIAMYPTMVVVLVISRRSVLERSTDSGGTLTNDMPPRFNSVRASRRRDSSIHYAPRTARSTYSVPVKSTGEDGNPWLEVNLGRSMQLTSLAPAPNDEEAKNHDEQSTSDRLPDLTMQ